jgi:hypothetical protein
MGLCPQHHRLFHVDNRSLPHPRLRNADSRRAGDFPELHQFPNLVTAPQGQQNHPVLQANNR